MGVVAGVDLGDPQFAACVRAGVTRIEELIGSELSQGDEMIYDAAPHSFQTEGTPLRPLFTVLAAQLGPNPNAWQITVAGAAIELLHLATLRHNDVVETAKVHGGASTANSRWNNNIAILAGDYRFAAASQLSSRLGPRAFLLIAETFEELVTGQMRETRGAAQHVDPIRHYLQVVHEKIGSLVAAAGYLGAVFSGASEDDGRRLSRLGRLLGTGSQIAGDIIAIAGDVDQSEHLAVTDVGDGRRTPTHRPLAGRHDDVADVFTLLASPAGMIMAKEVVGTYAAQAHDELACLPDCAARRALLTLVDATVVQHD